MSSLTDQQLSKALMVPSLCVDLFDPLANVVSGSGGPKSCTSSPSGLLNCPSYSSTFAYLATLPTSLLSVSTFARAYTH